MISKILRDRAGDVVTLSSGELTARRNEVTVHVRETFRGREHTAAAHVDAGDLRAALDEIAPAPMPSAITDEMVEAFIRAYMAVGGPQEGAVRAGFHASLPAAPAPKTDEDDLTCNCTYALDLIAQAQAKTTEAEARAEKAEEERDRVVEVHTRVRRERDEALTRVRELESLTAREHLDAALFEEVMIAQRMADNLRALYPDTPMATDDITEAVIEAFDPPTPKRPEGAEDWDEELGEMPAASDLTPEQRGRLADALAERDHALGVRVTEDGEGEG
ncbi:MULTISPECIES: hypothetical protein [Brachybacterium]|uniref:Uncharacterized protein n=1 Tax=Brachybacterium kimchii TaxID=2942909 RepID=A0ABY4N7P1_9MICO|nr:MULTISPECIES: hypothetical protein [Brachybacterium]MCG7309720.1 hypothetical protein [Brachybacterium sp. ACRRE]UQN30567.1 hypothetical protein M4486_04440 [Brachybacterium kimchii]